MEDVTQPSDTEPEPTLDRLTVDELKRVAQRERNRINQQRHRAAQATAHAAAALLPNPSGYVVPPVPAGLHKLRKWVRSCHDAYSQRRIGVTELAEVRRSASALGDLYKAGAEVRRSEAALRSAAAQEQLVASLQALEHGGAAVMLLAQLQQGLAEGKRRPLPGRVFAAPPVRPGDEPA
jgi:hypothetical protein